MSITYSWTGGYGRGDVTAEIHSSGESVLTLAEHGASQQVLKAPVSPDRFGQLVKKVLEGNLLCLESKRREVCITDIRRTSILVRVDPLSKGLWFDGKHYLPGGDGFDAITSSVYGLEDVFCQPLDWGPYGHTSMPCDGS